jgi:gliding motility-associated-like protein
MGTSVKFYDQVPYNTSATLLNNTFYTPNYILGKCSNSYTVIIAPSRSTLDSISAFVNQDDPSNELNQFNNQTAYKNFRLKYKVLPTNDTTVYINDTLSLKLKSSGEPINSIQWFTSAALDCFTCMKPTFIITDTSIIKSVAKTTYDCYDSTTTRINIFPIDISISNNSIYCYKNDSLLIKSTICLGNHYTALKKPTEIKFFDALDTLATGTNLLGTHSIPATTNFVNSCTTIEHIISKTSTALVSYYINSNLSLFEQMLANNQASTSYEPFRISTATNPIDIYRRAPTIIYVDHFGDSITSLKWFPSSGLSCDTCLSPTLQLTTNKYYQVKAKTKYDCTDSLGININVYFQNTLALPNVFTPNGDGLNDYFYVIAGKDVVKVKSFSIFNRWGKKVFEKNNIFPNDYYGGWDGTTNGKAAEMGTYVYEISLVFIDGSIKNYNGTISLIR